MRQVKIIYVLLCLYVLSCLLFIFPSFSDETFYFNVAKQVSVGKILYKDFFFAHPPLQTFTIASLFNLLGVSYFTAKLLPILSSAFSLVLVYLISKELKAKAPIFSSLILLFSPAFFSYHFVGYGVLPAMVFVLVSFYLLLRRKESISALFFTLAFFTRYLAILYLPFFLYKAKNKPRFLSLTVLFLIFGVFCCYLVFGMEFINDTFLFHLLKFGERDLSFINDYFGLNLFLLIPLFLFKRDNSFFLVFFADLLIMLLFKVPFYHYFLISIPFYAVFLSKLKDKKLIIICLLFGFLLNVQTISYYNLQNPVFSQIDSFFELNPDSVVFGEPIIVNYLSFTGQADVLDGVYDSYSQHLSFEEIVFSKEPDFVIDLGNYYSQFFNDTELVFVSNSKPVFSVFRLRR